MFTEKSNKFFLHVLNKNADNKETIKITLNKLNNDYGIHKIINYLVVVGDGTRMIIYYRMNFEMIWHCCFP